jgi:hypothetical protein
MPENFIARPTDVFVSYLAQRQGTQEKVERRLLTTGRIAMGLEIVSVIRLLEDHDELVVHAPEAISILQTLLNDQDLHVAHEIYDELCEWRRIKLGPDEAGTAHASDDASHDAQPSDDEAPPRAQPLP